MSQTVLEGVFCNACDTRIDAVGFCRCHSCDFAFCTQCLIVLEGIPFCSVCADDEFDECDEIPNDEEIYNDEENYTNEEISKHTLGKVQDPIDESVAELHYCSICERFTKDEIALCTFCDYIVCLSHMVTYDGFESCHCCKEEYEQEKKSPQKETQKETQKLTETKPQNKARKEKHRCEICFTVHDDVVVCEYCDYWVCTSHIVSYDGYTSCVCCKDEYDASTPSKISKAPYSETTETKDQHNRADPQEKMALIRATEPRTGSLRLCSICTRKTRHPVLMCDWCSYRVCRPHLESVDGENVCDICLEEELQYQEQERIHLEHRNKASESHHRDGIDAQAVHGSKLESGRSAVDETTGDLRGSENPWGVDEVAVPLIKILVELVGEYPDGVPGDKVLAKVKQIDFFNSELSKKHDIPNHMYYCKVVSKLGLVEIIPPSPFRIKMTPKMLQLLGK
eukprot:TRINITY_DN9281_c0_g1_i1.p1 TRINITY_DN9281_c0_g1~~TRINITY_DN9281_c0_g1_i1.p1  ORF type:complete len:453 (+),score=106.09 TRINITY_DN9281_c0_g1_i1:50-1408(+)